MLDQPLHACSLNVICQKHTHANGKFTKERYVTLHAQHVAPTLQHHFLAQTWADHQSSPLRNLGRFES